MDYRDVDMSKSLLETFTVLATVNKQASLSILQSRKWDNKISLRVPI